MEEITLECAENWEDWELLDSGDGEKLERFGTYIVSRPDPRALWKKSNPQTWDTIHAKYLRETQTEGHWKIRTPAPVPWHIRYKNLTFTLRSTEFKHVGVFPEQAANWDWIDNHIHGKNLKILNLFAYTGGATLTSSLAGAIVTHVDSVKNTISWARENARLSGITHKPIRWIEEDAYKFVLREGRRGASYDGIIMDPPRFGRGSKGEVWKLEEDLPKLLAACKNILSPQPHLILINAYTADLSSLVIHHLLADLMGEYKGTITFGELVSKESTSERTLPQGIFARWSRNNQ